MRLTLLKLSAIAVFFLCFSVSLSAQGGFSFNCTRDTIMPGCSSTPCFNLTTIIPDLHGLSESYTVNPIANPAAPCFPVYANPNSNGTPVGLTVDDRYSADIPIGFTFPFFGTGYTNLVVSTNGYISFNTALANSNSHYGILRSGGVLSGQNGTPEDLPSLLYDGAIIMGPYHDLNPQIAQPSQRIQYVTLGAAPYRKWVLSFYQVPLFGPGCGTLFNNTHQIVLHESSGIVEVLMFSKDICTSWNQGRAMIGMQDMFKVNGIMVPNRRASDAPWGTLNMNEGYRFVPSGGPSLFRRAELYDIGGTLLGTDVVATPQANGTRVASFPNVCPPAGATTTYLVRSFYTKIDDPAVEVMGTDTIRVTKGNPGDLNATASSLPSTCGPPTGSVSVTVPTGATPIQYSIDGGPVSSTNFLTHTFSNVASGNHVVVVRDASGVCMSTININVQQINNLTANVAPNATSCTGIDNGRVNVNPINGSAPYTFTLNPGNIVIVGPTASFQNLPAGNYTVTIADAGGCSSASLPVTVAAGQGLLATTTQTATSCTGASNASATFTLAPNSNGTAPYTYTLDGGPISQTTSNTSATFNGLSVGVHFVIIRDALGCQTNPINVNIAQGPPISTTATHTDALCNGATNGTITVAQPASGLPPFEYSLDGVAWQTSNQFTGLAPGQYTVYFRDNSNCQGNIPQTIGQPNALTATNTISAVRCFGQSDGVITIATQGGVAPIEYSINGGLNWQFSNVFNVPAGAYTVTIRDANLCTITQNITITQPTALTASAITSNATCNGGNDGVLTITANGGNAAFQYSIDGTTFQPSNIFNVAPGTYTATIRDAQGCIVTVPNQVVGLTNDLTTAPMNDTTICEGSSAQLSVTTNGTQFAWSPVTGLSNPSIANPTANPTITTNYIVTVSYGRCTADVPVTVNVNAAPIADAGADGFICVGQSYTLQGSGGVIYNWTPNTGLTSTSIANPVTTPDRTTVYTLQVVDANGCPSLVADQVTVDVTPPINIFTSPADTVVYTGDQFQLNASSAATSYLWSPATNLSNPNIANPIVTAGAVGDFTIYKVVGSTIAGCRGEGFVRVRVYDGPDLYVPSGFTPNNDGKNDKFFPFPVGIKELKLFRVYNRWGQLVYSTSKLNDGWDGKTGGILQQTGVYVWTVEGVTRDNKIITKRGTVTLIR